MNFKKNYLTIEELDTIVNQMKEETSACGREMVRVGMTAMYCLNHKYTQDTGLNEIYNDLAKDGTIELFDEHISNYYKIDQLVKQELSFYKIVDDLLSMVKNVDATKMQNALKELGNGSK